MAENGTYSRLLKGRCGRGKLWSDWAIFNSQSSSVHDPAACVVAVVGRVLCECIRMDALAQHV